MDKVTSTDARARSRRHVLSKRDGGTEVEGNRHSGKEREFPPTFWAGAILIGRAQQSRSYGAEVNNRPMTQLHGRLLPLPNSCASR